MSKEQFLSMNTSLYRYPLLLILLTAALVAGGCSNPEKSKAEHLSKADALYKEGKFQEASIEYRNAIQIDDKLAAAHWGLAQAYEKQERFQEAVEEIKRTIELDGKNLDAKVKLGNYYILALAQNSQSSQKPQLIAEAERLAKEVLDANPNHIEGHILNAGVLYAQEKRNEALAELNKAVGIDPNRVESRLSVALFYSNIGDKAKAEESYKQAISLNNSSVLAHLQYGTFLAQQKQFPEAEKELRKAVELEPKNRDAQVRLATFYVFTKQNDKAEEAYKALVAADSKVENRVALADFYATVMGRPDDAINIYKDIIAKSPEYSRAYTRLSQLLLQRGDVKGATEQVNAILKKNEHDMEGLLLRANIRLQSGQNKEAIEDLKEVLKQDPTSRPGLYSMAEANLRLGQLEEARVYAGDLEKYHPENTPTKVTLAQISLASGDAKTAVRLTTELLDKMGNAPADLKQTDPFNAELRMKALTVRGTANAALKNFAAARADMQGVINLAPNSADAYSNLAGVAASEDKLDEAVQLYEKALEKDPAHFNSLSNLVTIYAKQNKADQAVSRLDQAINAQQDKAPLHYLKAQALGFQKNAQGAEAELRRALELDPNYLAAYFALGSLYVNTNQEDRAIAEYQKVTEKQSDSDVAYTLIGMLEDSRKNYDASSENYRKALAIKPNNVIAANNLAWNSAEYGKGNLDEAVRLAQDVVQRFPDQPGFADTLGWVYYKKGLHAAAVEQLKKAVAKQSDNASYRYHLGVALAGMGNKAEARRELEQALRLGEGKNFAQADAARQALAST